ncbi:S-layer homology domain-containing protein [Fuchsiella alkaliacetigena]|uniref:S-layer homology domain-containing protein n=1 Tax=Fuchsiella alkaliacetigena TaxID=957042 RepID=UPI00200B6628|nr:S-layer homology domain-containing protein [Fuchsiella alkaliacetigena]MCK8824246.1 S-layer homology domain-containing protein [Fuchsiella alkaliacetigena]
MIKRCLTVQKLITLILVWGLLLTATLPVLASDEIEDISPDHWAYESVRRLIDEGVMSLQEDNYFEGEEKIERYELAEVIAKLLVNIEQRGISASEEDLKLLRELSTEFREELVELNQESDFFAQEMERLQEENKILREDLLNTKEEMLAVKESQEEARQIIEEITQEQEEFQEEVEIRLAELEAENEQLYQRIDALEESLEDGGDIQEKLDREVKNLRFAGLGLLLLIIASY